MRQSVVQKSIQLEDQVLENLILRRIFSAENRYSY